MVSQENLLGLIAQIYDAAADPSLWPNFLESFANAMHGTTTAIVYQDLKAQRPLLANGVRFDPDYARRYFQHYGNFDPWRKAWMARFKTARPEAIVASDELVDMDVLQQTEYYNDYLVPQQTVHQVGGPIVISGHHCAIVTCLRPHGGGPFNPEELKLFRLLFPHLRRAMDFHRVMAELEGKHRASLEALDMLSTGAILLDQQGHILELNNAAQEIVNQNDGIIISERSLITALAEQTRKLQMYIASSIRRGANALIAGGVLRIDRPSGKRSFVVIVMPVSQLALPPLAKRPSAILFVNDPETASRTTPETLASAYGLTGAESRVAEKLMMGCSLIDAAEQLGITHNTARSQLQRIYEKTGTRHQGELVRLLIASSTGAMRR